MQIFGNLCRKSEYQACSVQHSPMKDKRLRKNIWIIKSGILGRACIDAVQVEKQEKRQKILEILKEFEKSTKVLMFCTAKKGADFLATQLSQKISTTSRLPALGVRQVLVATAIAARGLGSLVCI